MTVYVDNVELPFGRMLMCHCWSDQGEAELVAFVKRIGVHPRWIQKPPKASWVHFDISKGMREKAVAAGAIETDMFGPAEHVARLEGNTKMLKLIENSRELRGGRVRVRLHDPRRQDTCGRNETKERDAKTPHHIREGVLPYMQPAKVRRRRVHIRTTRRP